MKKIISKIRDIFKCFVEDYEFYGSMIIVFFIGALILAIVGIAVKTKECTDLIRPPDKEIIKEVVYIYSER